MNYGTQDTSWTISAKGNHWRRLDGKFLVVGQFKANNYFWAMKGQEFLKGRFTTIDEAKYAAERGIDGDDYCADSEDGGW